MTISSQTRKAGPYTGNGSTTSFPFAFKVFVNTDVLVVRTNLSGVETVLTLGTDYTVSLNSNQDSNAGGNVVLPTALTSGFLLTIASKVPLLQQTDFTNQGGFYPAVLNASLDKLTILTQQLNEEVARSAKLPISNSADAATLTAAILQLANDQTNIDAVAGDLANIDAVAGNATNINTVAGISANVTTVAGISSDVTAVAGNATNITAVKNNATNINTVAGISSNVTTVAGISSAVSTNATNASAISTNASNITAIQNASTNATNAANSATAAAASASAASTSETNAATSAAAAAASAASGMYSAVQDKSANYTVVAGDAGDLIRVNTSGGARTITLPAISTVSDGFKVAIVKWTGDGNAVTIARSSSDTINGATSYALGNQYSSATFVADAETATWFAAASGLGTTNANVDVFSGNNSTTAFTLSGDAGSKNNTLVTIGGVYQAKSTYSLSGTTLTFSTAPPTGTSNIEVVWNSPLAIGTPSDDTVSTAKLQAGAVTPAKMSTGAPTWDSSGNVQVNPSPAAGSFRTHSLYGNRSSAGQTVGTYNFVNGTTEIANLTAVTRGTTSGGQVIAYAADNAGSEVEAFRFNPNGIGLGGAAPSSGTGITFPTVQNASSNAKTLDDYEEGTFTPVLTGSVSDPTVTYSAQSSGNYTKVGSLVRANFAIYVNTISGGSGYARISLPFVNAGYSAQGALRIENATGISTFNMAALDDLGAVARCYVRINTNATGNGADLQISNLQAGTRLVGTFIYWAQ